MHCALMKQVTGVPRASGQAFILTDGAGLVPTESPFLVAGYGCFVCQCPN